MAVLGFAHMNLRAPRALLDELRDFYVDVVGLAPGPRPPFRNFGYWLYAGGRDVLHLSEASAGEVRTRGRSHTYDHLALACDDLASTEARLRSLGISYRRAEVPMTGQSQLFFDDPAGNGVELNFTNGQ